MPITIDQTSPLLSQKETKASYKRSRPEDLKGFHQDSFNNYSNQRSNPDDRHTGDSIHSPSSEHRLGQPSSDDNDKTPKPTTLLYNPSNKVYPHEPTPQQVKSTTNPPDTQTSSEKTEMDFGILRALDTVRNNPYVNYVGIGLAGLVKQKELHDPETGAPLRKTKMQLVRISAAVCGIELCYAAETAFVSPILLKLGVPTTLMTMVWCLSPFLGFFLVPIMGSLSDQCKLKMGRRRPFIMIMAVGILVGLVLVPNGESLGVLLGDVETRDNVTFETENSTHSPAQHFSSGLSLSMNLPIDNYRGILITIAGVALLDSNCDGCQSPSRAYLLDVSVPEDHPMGLTMFTVMAGLGGCIGYVMGGIRWNASELGDALGSHVQVVFIIVTTAFIICMISTLTAFKETPLGELNIQAETTQKKKKRVGKSKYKRFTNEDSTDDSENGDVGGFRSKKTFYGALNGGGMQKSEEAMDGSTKHSNNASEKSKSSRSDYFHTLPQANHISSNDSLKTSSLSDRSAVVTNGLDHTAEETKHTSSNGHIIQNGPSLGNHNQEGVNTKTSLTKEAGYHYRGAATATEDGLNPYTNNIKREHDAYESPGTLDELERIDVSTDVTLKTYFKSIVRMPASMWILCAVNLLCWMSLVCYSLYFTDFVGQAVFGGDPTAPETSQLHKDYVDGVRLGCLGMSLYSLSCSCYSMVIERLIRKFRAKRVYVISQLIYSVGMIGMAVFRTKWAVIVFSPTAGVMYATLFTMPYVIIAHYHTRGLFSHMSEDSSGEKQVRGLGTDVAVVSSMVFLAQFILSSVMGYMVAATGTPATVIITSSVLSFLGAVLALKVTYLDL